MRFYKIQTVLYDRDLGKVHLVRGPRQRVLSEGDYAPQWDWNSTNKTYCSIDLGLYDKFVPSTTDISCKRCEKKYALNS